MSSRDNKAANKAAKKAFENALNSLNDEDSKASAQVKYNNMKKLYDALSDEDKKAYAGKMAELEKAAKAPVAPVAKAPAVPVAPTTSVNAAVQTKASTNAPKQTAPVNDVDPYALTKEQMKKVTAARDAYKDKWSNKEKTNKTEFDRITASIGAKNKTNTPKTSESTKSESNAAENTTADSEAKQTESNAAENTTADSEAKQTAENTKADSEAKQSLLSIIDQGIAYNKYMASKRFNDWYNDNLYGEDAAAKKAKKMESDYRALNEYNSKLNNDDKIYGKNLSDDQKVRLQKRRNNGNELQKMADESGLKYSSLVWDAVGSGLTSMANAMEPLTGKRPFKDTSSAFSRRMNKRLEAASTGQANIVELENKAIEKAGAAKIDSNGRMYIGGNDVGPIKDYLTNELNFSAMTAEGQIGVIKAILGSLNLAGHSVKDVLDDIIKQVKNGSSALDALMGALNKLGVIGK